MNVGPILLGTVGGGIGLGLGGLVGMLVNMARGKPSRIGLYLGLILAIVGARVATYSRPPPPDIEAGLESAGAPYRAIRQYYPEVFAEMAGDLKAADPRDPVALQNALRPRLSALVAAHRSEMDDDSTNALGRLMLDETLALQSSNPRACAAILGGSGAPRDLGPAIPPDLARRDGEVTAQILTQVATHPAAPPAKLSDAETQALFGAALKELSADEQKLMTPMLERGKTPDTTEEARAYCAFYRDLFMIAIRGQDQTLRRFLTH